MVLTIRKYYPLIIQLFISVLALLYVVYKVLQFSDWSFFFDQLLTNKSIFFLLLFFQLLLSVINISLEAVKWQMLSKVVTTQSFYDSFRQVVRGIQLGMLTPARLGDPVGKAMLFKREQRTSALLLSAAGSIMQSIVIIFSGLVSLFILQQYQLIDLEFFKSIQKAAFQYGFLLPLFILLIIGGLFLLVRYLLYNPFLRRINFHIYRKLGFILIIKLFAVTFLRYLIFSFQLWLLLDFFGVIDAPVQWWLIPMYYTIITFIPAIALADLGIRGSIALFVFAMVSDNSVAVITSVFIIWLYNLALPSLFGFFLLRRKK